MSLCGSPIDVYHLNQSRTRQIRLDRFGETLDFRVIALSVSEYCVLEWRPASLALLSRSGCGACDARAGASKKITKHFDIIFLFPCAYSRLFYLFLFLCPINLFNTISPATERIIKSVLSFFLLGILIFFCVRAHQLLH